MDIKDLKKNWNELGKKDVFFAIISNERLHSDEFFAIGKEEIEGVMRHANTIGLIFDRLKALDFGCGVGRLTQALGDYFDEVCGVDIAPSMIDLANKYNRYANKCQYFVNEVDNLQIFPEKSFDFIYSNITLRHMEPRYSKAYIKEFLRILFPKGVAIFYLPAVSSLRKKILSCVKPLIPDNIYALYLRLRYGSLIRVEEYSVNPNEIINMVKNCGGELIDLQPKKGRYTIRRL